MVRGYGPKIYRKNTRKINELSTKMKIKVQKNFFSLMARPLTPPPLNGPVIKRRTFFAASLNGKEYSDKRNKKKNKSQEERN